MVRDGKGFVIGCVAMDLREDMSAIRLFRPALETEMSGDAYAVFPDGRGVCSQYAVSVVSQKS